MITVSEEMEAWTANVVITVKAMVRTQGLKYSSNGGQDRVVTSVMARAEVSMPFDHRRTPYIRWLYSGQRVKKDGSLGATFTDAYPTVFREREAKKANDRIRARLTQAIRDQIVAAEKSMASGDYTYYRDDDDLA